MKDIESGSIRPPSESESLLIRVTKGCHWNKCYFCGLYKSMKFSLRPLEETITDIKRQAKLYQRKKFKSCFLRDGDALVLKSGYLLRMLEALNKYFPVLEYITSYACADSITRKSLAELKELRQDDLNHLYCGMETGSDTILQLINKGFNADTVVKSGCMAKVVPSSCRRLELIPASPMVSLIHASASGASIVTVQLYFWCFSICRPWASAVVLNFIL